MVCFWYNPLDYEDKLFEFIYQIVVQYIESCFIHLSITYKYSILMNSLWMKFIRNLITTIEKKKTSKEFRTNRVILIFYHNQIFSLVFYKICYLFFLKLLISYFLKATRKNIQVTSVENLRDFSHFIFQFECELSLKRSIFFTNCDKLIFPYSK